MTLTNELRRKLHIKDQINQGRQALIKLNKAKANKWRPAQLEILRSIALPPKNLDVGTLEQDYAGIDAVSSGARTYGLRAISARFDCLTLRDMPDPQGRTETEKILSGTLDYYLVTFVDDHVRRWALLDMDVLRSNPDKYLGPRRSTVRACVVEWFYVVPLHRDLVTAHMGCDLCD